MQRRAGWSIGAMFVVAGCAGARAPARPRAGAGVEPPAARTEATAEPKARRAAPCDELDARQRAGLDAVRADARMPSVDIQHADVRPALRRCVFVPDGAIGLVPERGLEGRSGLPRLAGRVVFVPREGEPVVSEAIHLREVGERTVSPLDLLVLPAAPGRKTPVTFVRTTGGHLVPAPLGEPVPVQRDAFFAALTQAEQHATRTDIVPVQQDEYRVDFRLPGLTFAPPPYTPGRTAGHWEEHLEGVLASAFLDSRYVLAEKEDLKRSVAFACRAAGPVLRAAPAELWSSAQCEIVRGETTAAVLARVSRRCDALAREALPLIEALATHRSQARDAAKVAPYRQAELQERLGRVNPPDACFEDSLGWNADYTGRSGRFSLPKKVTLVPAWRSGLEVLAAIRFERMEEN